MNRSTLLLVAGIVALAGCVDAPTDPSMIRASAPSFNLDGTDGVTTTGNHIVVFSSSNKIPASFSGRVAALGGTVEAAYDKIGVAVVSGLSADAVSALQATSGIGHVEADLVMQMIDPSVDEAQVAAADETVVDAHNPAAAFFFPRQWNMRAIGAHTAWTSGATGSPSVTIAILDTGLDYTHADLAGRVDLSRSKSFVPSDDAFLATAFPGAHPVADMHFHGTHVGATVSSNAVAAAGVTAHTTLIGVKVLSRTGSGATSGVLAGIMYAADAGADVINMSLGVQTPIIKANFPGISSVYNRAVNYAHREGVVVVVSAGNENQDMDTFGDELYKPYCTVPQVVCVSATGPTSAAGVNGPWANVDSRALYSNYGVNFVTVAAPGGANGGSVTAACSRFTTITSLLICRTGTFVVGSRGTSMAAPHVSGLAALIVEREGKNKPGVVRNRLHQSADDLGLEGADPIYGKGRINVARGVGL